MMNNEVVYIVGDRFVNFSQLENVFTVSDVFSLIKENTDLILHRAMLYIGQGVSIEEKRQLEILSKQNKIGFIINSYQLPASNEITHKNKNKNIMITEPLVVIPGKYYRSYLTTDDGCAEMEDHLTGQHIQGMVLTEAARQMMLAVAEKYILKLEERGNSYCVLTTVNSHFIQFAFPVDIKIEHEILDVSSERRGFYDVKTQTNFIQNETIITYVNIDYKFFSKRFLSRLESQLAEQTLKFSLSRILNNTLLDAEV